MTTQWYIGTIRAEPRSHQYDLAILISQTEHDEMRRSANMIRTTLRGVLFRLVFANHRSFRELHDRLESLIHDRGVNWGEAQTQLQLALANWLASVRWLLDHTKFRVSADPEKLELFEAAKKREFDNNVAYRLTYKLRDFATHCDLPPLSLHVESRLDADGGVVGGLDVELHPKALLDAWHGWKALVTRDLRATSDPINVIDLVDNAMASIERIMTAIIAADSSEHRAIALRIVDAVERLPVSPGAIPALFAAEVDGQDIKSVSPTPLPIDHARELLNAPAGA